MASPGWSRKRQRELLGRSPLGAEGGGSRIPKAPPWLFAIASTGTSTAHQVLHRQLIPGSPPQHRGVPEPPRWCSGCSSMPAPHWTGTETASAGARGCQCHFLPSSAYKDNPSTARAEAVGKYSPVRAGSKVPAKGKSPPGSVAPVQSQCSVPPGKVRCSRASEAMAPWSQSPRSRCQHCPGIWEPACESLAHGSDVRGRQQPAHPYSPAQDTAAGLVPHVVA